MLRHLGMILVCAGLSACSVDVQPGAMIVDRRAETLIGPNHVLYRNVVLDTVNAHSGRLFGGAGVISPSEVEESLRQSLKLHVMDGDQKARYRLKVTLVDFRTPFKPGQHRMLSVMKYELLDRKSGEVIWGDTIEYMHKMKRGTVMLPDTLARVALQDSIKANLGECFRRMIAATKSRQKTDHMI